MWDTRRLAFAVGLNSDPADNTPKGQVQLIYFTYMISCPPNNWFNWKHYLLSFQNGESIKLVALVMTAARKKYVSEV